MASNESMGHPLRLITYLSPGIPLGIYQMYQHYLEEMLGITVYLMVESRYSGPRKDRNPFDQDDVDMGELFLDKQNITRFSE